MTAPQIPCQFRFRRRPFGCLVVFLISVSGRKQANRIQEQVGGQGASEGPFHRRADTEGFLGCLDNKCGALGGLEKENSFYFFVSLVNISKSKSTWKENSLGKQGKEATVVSVKCAIDAFQLFPLCSLVL